MVHVLQWYCTWQVKMTSANLYCLLQEMPPIVQGLNTCEEKRKLGYKELWQHPLTTKILPLPFKDVADPHIRYSKTGEYPATPVVPLPDLHLLGNLGTGVLSVIGAARFEVTQHPFLAL